MNPEQLLQHFDRISEAPDAIARLRRFILDLAVRGKLVEQDPNDEPASELLLRIQAAEPHTKAAKKSKKGNVTPKFDTTQYPFAIPASWSWNRLGQLGHTQTGTTPSKSEGEIYGSHIPFIKPGDLFPNWVIYTGEGLSEIGIKSSGRLAPKGTLLMVCIGTIGKCQLIDRDCSFNQQINALTPHQGLVPKYLLTACLSGFFQQSAWQASARTTIAILNKGKWEQLLLPIPPLAEQHRIVAKVDELMALCDSLQAAQTECEQKRDRLVAASLHRLNPTADDAEANTPDVQCENARFLFNHLPRLTTRPEHIKQLRQTILDLAVRGKLVPQDPNDEPASDLLKRIHAEKSHFHRQVQSKKSQTSLEIFQTDIDIPLGWQWVNFSDYALEISTGPFGSALHQSDYVLDGIPLVNPSHMAHGRIKPDRKVSVSEETANRLASYRMKPGDIVMARRGEVGRAALVTEQEDGWLCGTGSFFLRFHHEVFREYILLLLQSQSIRKFLAGEAVGITMGNLNHGILKRMPLAIPPLAEQHRIIAKVDELMALCDQLETQLAGTAADSRRLLEAVLHQALLPAEQAA